MLSYSLMQFKKEGTMKKLIVVSLAVVLVFSCACFVSVAQPADTGTPTDLHGGKNIDKYAVVSMVAEKKNAGLGDSHVELGDTYFGFGVLIEADDYDTGVAYGYVIDPYGGVVGVDFGGTLYYYFWLNMETSALYGCPYTNCGSSDFYYIGSY